MPKNACLAWNNSCLENFKMLDTFVLNLWMTLKSITKSGSIKTLCRLWISTLPVKKQHRDWYISKKEASLVSTAKELKSRQPEGSWFSTKESVCVSRSSKERKKNVSVKCVKDWTHRDNQISFVLINSCRSMNKSLVFLSLLMFPMDSLQIMHHAPVSTCLVGWRISLSHYLRHQGKTYLSNR